MASARAGFSSSSYLEKLQQQRNLSAQLDARSTNPPLRRQPPASPPAATAPANRGQQRANLDASLANETVRVLASRLEEVERHCLACNDNLKNCTQLIKLTQGFSEEQGQELARRMEEAKLEQGETVAGLRALQARSSGAEASAASRLDALHGTVGELARAQRQLAAGQAAAAEARAQTAASADVDGGQARALVEELVAKSEERLKELVAERIDAEVGAAVGRVERLAELMLSDLSTKYEGLQRRVDEISDELSRRVDSQLATLTQRVTKKIDAVEVFVGRTKESFQEVENDLRRRQSEVVASTQAIAAKADRAARSVASTSEQLGKTRNEMRYLREKNDAGISALEEKSLGAVDELSSKLLSVLRGVEDRVGAQLSNAASEGVQKETIRFQALTKSVEERLRVQSDGARLLERKTAAAINAMEQGIAARLDASTQQLATSQRKFAADTNTAVLRIDGERRLLAEELQVIRAADSSRNTEMERRIVQWEQDVQGNLDRSVASAWHKHREEQARREERLFAGMAESEARLTGRVDDCFTQIRESLDLYKQVRAMYRETGDRAKQMDALISDRFSAMSSRVEKRIAAHRVEIQRTSEAVSVTGTRLEQLETSRRGVAKAVAKSGVVEFVQMPSSGEVQPDGTVSMPMPSFGREAASWSASSSPARRRTTTSALDSSIGSPRQSPSGPRSRADVKHELEASIVQMRELVTGFGGADRAATPDGSVATDPGAAGTSSGASSDSSERTVGGAESDGGASNLSEPSTLRRDRQQRQQRLNSLYRELASLESSEQGTS